jgi:hypothetical protein
MAVYKKAVPFERLQAAVADAVDEAGNDDDLYINIGAARPTNVLRGDASSRTLPAAIYTDKHFRTLHPHQDLPMSAVWWIRISPAATRRYNKAVRAGEAPDPNDKVDYPTEGETLMLYYYKAPERPDFVTEVTITSVQWRKGITATCLVTLDREISTAYTPSQLKKAQTAEQSTKRRRQNKYADRVY